MLRYRKSYRVLQAVTPLLVCVTLAFIWFLELRLRESPQIVWLTIVSLGIVAIGVSGRMELLRSRHADSDVRSHLERLLQMEHHELAGIDQFAWQGAAEWSPLFDKFQNWLSDKSERLDDLERARSRAEVRLSRLSDQQSQVREVFDGLVEPILVTNQYNEVVLANTAAQRLFAISDLETRPKLEQFIESSELIDLARDTRQRKSLGARFSEIEMGEQEDRRWYRVCCRGLPLGAPAEDAEQGTVLVLTDICTEKGIQKHHAEFVAAASHEMKTPLAGIRAYVELLRDGEAEDEATREEFLEVIDTQSDRLQRLIENLLNLARIEAGVVNVDKQQHSLNELLEKAISVVQPSSEQKQIELVKDLSPMYLGVLADRDMIMQAAINLLSNAIKYTESKGKVTLRSRMEDRSIVFEVEDSGVGLSEEDAGKVFEKFYRVKKDQQMASGTGLGLPLAKHIVEDVHGGSLSVASRLGEGSTFRISLPGLRTVKV